MAMTLVISILSVLGMVALLIWKPTIKVASFHFSTFYFPPLLGAIILLLFQNGLWDSFIGSVTSNSPTNPLKLLVLFFSMSFLSLALDEAGFFSFLAGKAIAHGKSQISSFILIYFVTGVLTVFTSNDIVVLTFTPFILSFCKRAKISPLPFLIEEFVSANTFSMTLLIGNPTNIYLSESAGLAFFDYLKIMLLPTLLAGGISFFLLFFMFRKTLLAKFECEVEEVSLKDKGATFVGILCLGICIILLSISSFIGIEMYIICAVLACLYLLFLLTNGAAKAIVGEKEGHSLLLHAVARIPYALVPFLLSMFVIVHGLSLAGVNSSIATFLSRFPDIYGVGLSSYIACSLINNIPMSVLFSELVPAMGGNVIANYYAAIIGSNLGALLTPLGALAGIMWMSMLDEKGCHLSFVDFTRYGVSVSLLSLIIALGGLQISLILFQ